MIESAASLDAERIEQLLDGGRGRHRHTERTGRLHDETEVLEVEIDLEPGLVRVGDVVGRLLIEALRSRQPAGERLQRQLAIEPGLLGQREGLSERGEIHGDDDLVGELGEAAETERSEIRDRLAHGLEDRQHGVEHRLFAGGPAAVVDNQWVTGLDQISCHGPSHDPKANESNCLRHVSPARAEILHTLGTTAPTVDIMPFRAGSRRIAPSSFWRYFTSELVTLTN